MSASLSASFRADYGGALNRCVAIIGRADQQSAGANRGKPQLGRWAFYWEGVFGAAQNVGRFWCRHPARLLWASGGHPRGQSRLICRPKMSCPLPSEAQNGTPRSFV
eukprot:scaffold5445_cov127-Isochrysis_galbana.AAC.1